MSNFKLYVSQQAMDSGAAEELSRLYGITVVVSENLTGNDWYFMDLDKVAKGVNPDYSPEPSIDEKEETMIELDEFKGWDYEELAKRWDIDTDAVALIKQHIMNSMVYDEDSAEMLDPGVKEDMLDFLGKLINEKDKHNYGGYIFVGLLLTAQEDDATFAQYYCTLLPHMWN